MKNKIKWMSLIVAMLMLAIAATPIFAQSDTDPVIDPAPVEQVSSFMDHPIVKLLADFFAKLFSPPAVEEPLDGDFAETDPVIDPVVPVVGEADPALEPMPAASPEEGVAALHEEQKLGFGEMTKLLQISIEALAACALESINCDVTLDSLVAEYKGGTGMGDLFKKYEKLEYTGVGQVRKAAEPKTSEPRVKSNNGEAKGKK